MSQQTIHYIVLFTALIGNGLGCLYIIRKNVLKYGKVFIISFLLASFLCLFFYALGFYRFALPLPYVLPAVAVSFSYLALYNIRYRPNNRTFPFFFMTLTIIFSIEVLLRDTVGFIKFRNGWDYWDSYSLYWIYLRLFDHIGEFIVPAKFRNPLSSDNKIYWILFIVVIVYSLILLYLLRYNLI